MPGHLFKSAYINAGTRPYKAKTAENKAKATVTIVFVNKQAG